MRFIHCSLFTLAIFITANALHEKHLQLAFYAAKERRAPFLVLIDTCMCSDFIKL